MARYIDAEELCRRLTECWHTNDTEKGKNIQAVIDRVITPIVVGTPTAEVEEVKHGYWKMEYHETRSTRGRLIRNKTFTCSNCNRRNGRITTKYCSNCGVKMDGGKEE